MKLSDYVVRFLEEEGVRSVFMVAGGGIMHLMESVSRSKKIEYMCPHHEQAAAMAAEASWRTSGRIGVGLATTGPGGTNMITGAVGAWMDSVPTVYITGQVNSKSMIGETGLRQRGVHEANIIPMIHSVTKYALTITDEKQIKYHLQKAFYLARKGRPGPVWLDIPIDIQAKEIEPDALPSFDPKKEFPKIEHINDHVKEEAAVVAKMLAVAHRPLFVAGHGIRLSDSVSAFEKLVAKAKVPVVTAKNAYDVLPDADRMHVGMAGINGERAANFAVQTADLIIVLGCRLALPFVGYNTQAFAPNAKKVVVDIDEKQLSFATIKIDHAIQCDVGAFINELDKQLAAGGKTDAARTLPDWSSWAARCQHWKKTYPSMLPEYALQKKFVNPYYFVQLLGDTLPADAIIALDQGAAFYCPTQAMRLKRGQRLFTNGGISPMGYGLPAAIGACVGAGKKEVICIHGDGGLQLSIQELQTIVHYKLPIKLFVFNNEGYLSIKHTQERYFGGHFVGSDPKSGVSCPDLLKIADAYGIPAERISTSDELRKRLPAILAKKGAYIVDIMTDPMQPFVPKVQSEKMADGKMVTKPLHDMYPYLEPAVLEKEMKFDVEDE